MADTRSRKSAPPQDAAGLRPAHRQHAHPRIVQSIADAVVTKADELYLVTRPDGAIPVACGDPEGSSHGFGLYADDTRYLGGYEVELGGQPMQVLAANAANGTSARFQLTNPHLDSEGTEVGKEAIQVAWDRVLDPGTDTLQDELTFTLRGDQDVELPVTLRFRASFEDVFEVRGLVDRPAPPCPPIWKGERLAFERTGVDGLLRRVLVTFSRPVEPRGERATVRLLLKPGQPLGLRVAIALRQGPAPAGDEGAIPDAGSCQERAHAELTRWRQGQTSWSTDSLLLDRILHRSLEDLFMLRSWLDGDVYYAAGVPWYTCLFGRDGLTASLQVLAFDPEVAARTLRLLAKLQGRTVDARREEEPGKVLHELRVGPLARAHQVPQDRYYGSVDVTALFLIVLTEHARWTGSLDLFQELRPQVEAALAWMDRYGDSDGDGFLDYGGRGVGTALAALVNQGWKDSTDAIVNDDGSLAVAPIALVEVQGYAYRAKVTVADLFRRAGEPERADALLRQAADLKARFEDRFWSERLGCYVLALQRGGHPCEVVSSNPGQAVWTGICDPERARRTVRRLMESDMFGGWGVRTLSTREKRYSPLGYHVGSVWPHDNALIAAAMRRVGEDRGFLAILDGMLDAASHFDHLRLPELFTGVPASFGEPVRYPVACHPQAWAAGSIPFILTCGLGLVPDGFAGVLKIMHPVLPSMADSIELKAVRVGQGVAHLRFTRMGGGVDVEVLGVEGELGVEILTGAPLADS